MNTATEKAREIKFVATAIKWFDKVNGNTYHSVRVVRCKDGKTAYGAFGYGYGEQYKQSAYGAMEEAGFLPKEYSGDNAYKYERENNYPIEWVVSYGLKRDCIANGKA